MTTQEMKERIRELEEENKKLKSIIYAQECDYDYEDTFFQDEALVNRMAAEKLAEEDAKVEERCRNDPDYEWEQRQIRYMETGDDDYMY